MNRIILILTVFIFIGSCRKKSDVTPSSSNTNSKYTVTYNGNGNDGGTVPIDYTQYSSGSTATVLFNSGYLSKSGYDFIGWNTSASGSGVDYAEGSTLSIGSSNVTLYAHWFDISGGTTHVTYSGNGNTSGTAPVDNTAYSYGSYITVKGNTGGLSKSGMTFQSWNTQSNGGGIDYLPGEQFSALNPSYTLYAIYQSSTSGTYTGFSAAGHNATKSSLTSSWTTQDVTHDFGATLVAVVWNGSQYVGFDIDGEVATKSSLTSSWTVQDVTHIFGGALVAVVWNGSQYVGFDIDGSIATKSSLTSSWTIQDVTHTFGGALVCVAWNGSQYVGFDIDGEVVTKSSLTSSWTIQDVTHFFGGALVCVAWNGSQYVGFDIDGEIVTKSSLTSSWTIQDVTHYFGAALVGVTYH